MTKNTDTLARVIALTLLGAAAIPAQAAAVSYELSGTIDEADGTSQMPAEFSGAAVGGTLSVLFTVDTKTPGQLLAPGDMGYGGPLISQSASVGAGSFKLDVSNTEIEIMHNAFSGGTYTSGYTLTNLGANVPSNFTGTSTAFELITQTSSSSPQSVYHNTSLANAPLSSSKATGVDAMILQFTNYVDGVSSSSGDIFVGGPVSVSKSGSGFAAPEMDSASLGSALTLLVGGAVVIASRRSKAA